MKKIKTIKILHKLPRGTKTNRYVVEIDGDKHHSAKISTNFGVGAEIKIDDMEFDEKWIEQYEKHKNDISYDDILAHLVEYKESNTQLKNCECGFWRDNEYEHILPEENKKLNLLDNGYKDELSNQYDKLNGKIHDGFSHLNSSQAFALNFFVPMIQEKLFDEFLDGIDHKEIGANFTYKFEEIKDKDEGTQLDFYLESGNQKFTFEVKYSEDAFGTAKNDARHIKKYNDIYVQKLEKVLASFAKEKFQEKFFAKYQLWRNICFADDNTNVCFVFPEFRTDLKDAVEEAKNTCKPKIQEKIHYIFVDDFVKKMKNSGNEKLENHYAEFCKKYLDIRKKTN